MDKSSFVSLFATNRNLDNGLKLSKVSNISTRIKIDVAKVDAVIKTWGYSLSAHVMGGFLGTNILWIFLILRRFFSISIA